MYIDNDVSFHLLPTCFPYLRLLDLLLSSIAVGADGRGDGRQ